jgi:hypothetical protein
MANFTEKGHAKNVANLGTMITFATGFGTGYNPSKKSISLPALNTLKEEAQKDLVVINTHYNNWSVAIEAQQSLLAKLNVRLTRVVNAAEACEVPAAVLRNVKALNKKLQGVKSHKVAEPVIPEGAAVAEEIPKTISTSRMSQDSRMENFEKLVQLLAEQPGYTPNEPDLQVPALQNLLADFKTKNEAVKNTQMLLSNARISRNKYFYDKENGLVKVAANVKKYVKSVYGAASPEYKQVSGLSFTNHRELV